MQVNDDKIFLAEPLIAASNVFLFHGYCNGKNQHLCRPVKTKTFLLETAGGCGKTSGLFFLAMLLTVRIISPSFETC